MVCHIVNTGAGSVWEWFTSELGVLSLMIILCGPYSIQLYEECEI